MITCSTCGKAKNLNIQNLDTPLTSEYNNYEVPELVVPVKTIQDSQSSGSLPIAPTPISAYNPFLPEVFPDLENLPYFEVPANPLLPEGYQEFLDYNSVQYMNGFLRTQIGKIAEVEFLIGSNSTVTHTGRLIAVGVNFLILKEFQSDSILTCDYYTIKFVRFFDTI